MTDNTTVTAEAYRQVELRLQSQLSAAIAADQRALGFAGMLVTAASILTGLAPGAAWGLGMLIGAGGFALAAAIAWVSARPVSFYMPGALYEDFAEDIAKNAPLGQVQAHLGRYHDQHANANDALMKRNARLVLAAFVLALVSLAFVIVTQLCYRG